MHPFAPHLFSMRWTHGAFIHWPVDADALEARVPDPLSVDTYRGRAWVSVVPFVLAQCGVVGTPSAARVAFPELNLRTYVRYDGHPGLYFFALDFGHRGIAALGARLTRLPCSYARMRFDPEANRIRSQRVSGSSPVADFEATIRPQGDASVSEPGSVAHWLLERRRFYHPDGSTVLYGDIEHEPWPIRRATLSIEHNSLFAAADLPRPLGDPRCHYCTELPITGSIFRRLTR
ncbi:YqjF family protein (plasmid) [Haloferacaceae archaeon DSL9]